MRGAFLAGLWRSVRVRHASWVLLVGVTYFGAARGGLALAYENSSVTAVWAPTGIALAALLLRGYRLWPGVALGALLANLGNGVPLVTVLGVTVGNTLEALVGAFRLLHVAHFRSSLERVWDVLALVLLGGVLSTMVSATVGVASLLIGNAVEAGMVASVWRTWWLGDMGGVLLVAPLLMLLASYRTLLRHFRRRRGEAAALAAALVTLGCVVFSSDAPVAFVFLAPLIWAALRFGQLAGAVASLVVAGIALAFTASGSGPFVQDTPDGSLLLSQAFAGTAAMIALLLAVATSQREKAEHSLRRAHDDLERKVRERTAALTQAGPGPCPPAPRRCVPTHSCSLLLGATTLRRTR